MIYLIKSSKLNFFIIKIYMYSVETLSKNNIDKQHKTNLESYLRSSFPGLTETNIKYLKTKTDDLSSIYNAIFKNICIYYNNRNTDFILMKIKEDIKEKQKSYLRDFCIGNLPMHLPPIQTLTNCVIYISKIIFSIIRSIRTEQFDIIDQIRQIIPNNLMVNDAQIMMGFIYGSIKSISYYERKMYDIDYTLLNGYNVYDYFIQTLLIAQQFKFVNLMQIEDSRLESEIMKVVDSYNGKIDLTIVKIITIGIIVGIMSVKKSYELGLKTDDTTKRQIIAFITNITEKLIKKLLPQELNQSGNCIEPIFSDENLKDLFNKIKKIKKTKLAIMCSNFNSDNPFDILKLLQDDRTNRTDTIDTTDKTQHRKNSVLCIEWSRDRKLFKKALIEMIMSNNFFDIMISSVELLSANLLEQNQYFKFNQSLIDYKKMKKRNRFNYGFEYE